jgi:hypothetical protein
VDLAGTLEATTLTLGEATPDTKALILSECVLEALNADVAGLADTLRFTSAATLLWEKGFGVGLCAQRMLLPFERWIYILRRILKWCHGSSCGCLEALTAPSWANYIRVVRSKSRRQRKKPSQMSTFARLPTRNSH